ncbi:cytochrome P450 2J4-like [Lytechinus variegatus]|uniref:cytochrome P450 2J4-like n=1 Tax=Lytechinus variegatus TaxID=7654 RepID=UPI001BB25065|nr:cytochrome P450 2J4-like [Lytechinus variegatus]
MLLQIPDFAGTAFLFILKINLGIIVAEGEVWRDHRKFTHSVFRELGVGKKSYEDTIRTEMDQLIRAIEEKRGSSFNPNILLGKAVFNVICTIMFGTQYTYDDYDFLKVLNFMNVFSRNLGGGGSILYLPIPGLAKVPFGVPKLMSKIISEFNDFAQAQIEAHERTIDPDNPRDYIDRYIIRMAQKKGTDSTLDQTNLRKSIMDLFFAGSDTTSTTLTWAILFMIAYPEVQSRVQAELDQVIGRDRNAKLDDRPNLPYTNAVLMEIQRKGAIVPLGLPHIAAADVTLDGYTIPKGAIIMANLWKVFNDGNLWKNPDAFKPERFLNQAGELIKKDELIFFSTGRRECPGKQLARVEVFLAFTTLLHRFTMTKPPNSPPLSFKGILGIARSASPFEICAVPRD